MTGGRWRAALRRLRFGQHHRRDAASIAVLLALLAGLLAAGEWTWRLDRVIYDRALSWWTLAPPQEITIVAIDDASIAAIGRWPWPRNVHATLLEKLASAQPRAVMLDLVLSEADPQPEHDALLARSLRRAGAVVLPVPWLVVNGRDFRWLEPVPEFAAVARLAAADAVSDADGVVRHVFLYTGAAQARRPHAALALLQAGGEAVHPHIRPERLPAHRLAADAWSRDQRLLLRYGGPPGHVPQVSYVDLLTGAVPAAVLRGHYVLIGMTGQGLGDTLATPVNAQHRAMPGVEVLAQTLQMLRSGNGVWAAPAGVVAWASGVLAAVVVLLLSRLGHRVALVAALGAAMAALVASMAAVGAGLWATPVPLMAAALLAYPLLSWRRLEFAVAGLEREIRLLDADAAAKLRPLPASTNDAIDVRLRRLHSAGTLLREARRFLADVLSSLPNGMLVSDGGGRVLMANAQAAALFEVGSADDLQGLDLARLLGEFSTAETTDWPLVLASLKPGGERAALQARLAGQGDYVLQLAAAELAGERRILVAIADVEPVKQAERQREEALAFVSHDLRSPAASIVLLADMGLAGAAGTPPDLLAEVRRLAQRLLAMSENFVRYAQADLVALQLSTVSLGQLLEQAVRDLRPQAADAGVALRLLPHDPQASATLDLELVSRAIANLAANAVRHSRRGGAVLLSTVHEAGWLIVQVSDQGSGLTPQQHAQLASGEDGLRSAHHDGIGLGLRFAQRVARRHGGRLHARPPVAGAGSVFELVLAVPVAVAAPRAAIESGIP